MHLSIENHIKVAKMNIIRISLIPELKLEPIQ